MAYSGLSQNHSQFPMIVAKIRVQNREKLYVAVTFAIKKANNNERTNGARRGLSDATVRPSGQPSCCGTNFLDEMLRRWGGITSSHMKRQGTRRALRVTMRHSRTDSREWAGSSERRPQLSALRQPSYDGWSPTSNNIGMSYVLLGVPSYDLYTIRFSDIPLSHSDKRIKE